MTMIRAVMPAFAMKNLLFMAAIVRRVDELRMFRRFR
jgi:hypothetical protein